MSSGLLATHFANGAQRPCPSVESSIGTREISMHFETFIESRAGLDGNDLCPPKSADLTPSVAQTPLSTFTGNYAREGIMLRSESSYTSRQYISASA